MSETRRPAWVRARSVALATMAFAALFALGACNDDSPDMTGPAFGLLDDEDDGNDSRIYDQVEFLGNPLASEVTIVKANHDAYNRTQPYNTAVFGPQSLAFINAFRGGQPEVANTRRGALPGHAHRRVVAESRHLRVAFLGARQRVGRAKSLG